LAANLSPPAALSFASDWTLFALVDGKIAFDKHGRRVNVKAEPAAKN
jgi:ribosomal protein L27